MLASLSSLRRCRDHFAAQGLARGDRVYVMVIRRHGFHFRGVGIKNPDTGLGARARAVPDRAVARDLELRLIGHLRRQIVREFLRLRVVAHRGAALAVVAEPDVALVHISEPTRLLSISYAVFCLKK